MLDFRALQAVSDLRAAARRQPRAVLRAIASRAPGSGRDPAADAAGLARVILRQGGRFEAEADRPLIEAALIAASQPQADTAAFAGATALLLADRLQHGIGDDDLGSHWQAFATAYAGLAPADRAAILQGFLTGTRRGLVRMPGGPLGATLATTRPGGEVDALLRLLAAAEAPALEAALEAMLPAMEAGLARRHLKALLRGPGGEPLTGDSLAFAPLLALASDPDRAGHAGATALLLAEALPDGDAEGWFCITLWGAHIDGWLALPPEQGAPILAGLRHLYESHPGWSPQPERLAPPRPDLAYPLLPADETRAGPVG